MKRRGIKKRRKMEEEREIEKREIDEEKTGKGDCLCIYSLM